MVGKLVRVLKNLTVISIKLLLLILFIGVTIYFTSYINKFKQQYPVLKLKLLGELDYIESKEIELLLGDLLLNNLWTLNLNVVKETLMLHSSWIDKLILKKRWPDELEVSVVSHKPIAIWNDNYFLTTSEKVLCSTKNDLKLNSTSLPKFYGSLEHKDIMLNTYFLLAEKLSYIGLFIQQLDFNKEQGMIVLLNNGIKLKLGTFDLSDRITRFTIAYKKRLHSSVSDISYVDLRYTNGIAVSWTLKDLNVE